MLICCEFCEISNNSIFTEHLWAAACVYSRSRIILTLDISLPLCFLSEKPNKYLYVFTETFVLCLGIFMDIP